MTAEQNTPDIEALEIVAAPAITTVGNAVGDRTPFQLAPCCKDPEACTHTGEDVDPDAETRNGIMWAIRPKNMLLMLIGQRVLEGHASNEPVGKLPAYRTFLDAAVDPASSATIWARIGDPTDALDEPDLDAMIETFMGRWVPGNPTGPRAASDRLPRTTGRPSTGRSRSTAKTRKA